MSESVQNKINENSRPFSWTVRTQDQRLESSSRQELFLESDQGSKQHKYEIDDPTKADKYYANDDDDDG